MKRKADRAELKGKVKPYLIKKLSKPFRRSITSGLEYPVTIFHSLEDGGYVAVATEWRVRRASGFAIR